MLSVLAENVLLLQQLAYQGQLRRALSVLKIRFSAHDHAPREFVLTSPGGLRVLTRTESGEEVFNALAGHAGRPPEPPSPLGGLKPPEPVK